MSSQEFSEDEENNSGNDIDSGNVAPQGWQVGVNPQQDDQGVFHVQGFLVEAETEEGMDFVLIRVNRPGSSGDEEVPQGPFIGDRLFQSMFWVTVVMCAIGIIGGTIETYFSGEENLQTDLSGECEAFSSSADIVG